MSDYRGCLDIFLGVLGLIVIAILFAAIPFIAIFLIVPHFILWLAGRQGFFRIRNADISMPFDMPVMFISSDAFKKIGQ